MNRSSQRISLSLSPEAYSTIISDMDFFQNGNNLDGFINRIISNYRETSDASISLAKERERDIYTNRIKSVSKTENVSQEDSECIERLVVGYTKELTIKMNSFNSGIPLKPRINNENYDDLCMGSSDFQEEAYYPREGRYIKALLEDYAQLPFFEREGVFFKDTIDIINESIHNGNVLKLKYTNRKQQQIQITVRPYKIASGPLLRYHYLIALPYDSDDEKAILTLRISRITDTRKLNKTSHIPQKEQNHIEEVIREKGIQYIVSQDSEIIVRLTDQGYKLYKSILYLRPRHSDIKPEGNNWLLTFVCAEEQIKNYFFQFKKDAEILSPTQLRDWFAEEYKAASEVYIADDK